MGGNLPVQVRMTDKSSPLRSVAGAAFGVAAIGGLAMFGGAVLQGFFGSPQPAVTVMPEDAKVSEVPAPSPTGQSGTVGETATLEGIAPEIATGRQDGAAVYAKDYMMVAAHPVAAQVGAAVLADGGSAADAIIATQMVLNLVEPQSSGIGGGGFLLYWDAHEKKLVSYDGRETAPALGNTDYLLTPEGEFKSFTEALTGGASVGVPGLLRMFQLVHDDQGVRPWAELFTPAVSLAEEGFPISPRMNSLIANASFLNEMEPASGYFFDPESGNPRAVGEVLRNPEFAETLRLIAKDGVTVFYEGPLAEQIVGAVQNASRNPGALNLDDMAGYQAVRRDPLCLHYRIYRACGMGPPSSGGSTVLQILGFLEYADRQIGDTPPLSVDAIHLFSEAMSLAFADRNQYLADTDFVSVPLSEMLAVPYLTRRAGTMDFSDALKAKRREGNPMADRASLDQLAPDLSPELPSTTHLVAVDRNGDVAVMTSSIENGFGSRIMVGGFLLNNQLTDFAWRAEQDGQPVANRYEPGKRPRSSMAPTLIFGPDGMPRLAIGSPGGSRIIGYVAKTVVGVLDWDLSIQEAIELPHFLNRNGPLELEDDAALDSLADSLTARGFEVKRRSMASGLHGVEWSGGLLLGGADPRREGLAVGERNLNRDLDSVFRDLIEAD